jgi:hypothetical protein
MALICGSGEVHHAKSEQNLGLEIQIETRHSLNVAGSFTLDFSWVSREMTSARTRNHWSKPFRFSKLQSGQQHRRSSQKDRARKYFANDSHDDAVLISM